MRDEERLARSMEDEVSASDKCSNCSGIERELYAVRKQNVDLKAQVKKWEDNEREKRKRASAILDMVHDQDRYINNITWSHEDAISERLDSLMKKK